MTCYLTFLITKTKNSKFYDNQYTIYDHESNTGISHFRKCYANILCFIYIQPKFGTFASS